MAISVDTTDITRGLPIQIRAALGENQFKRKLGRLGIKIIQERTRAGFGFRSTSQTNLTRLKNLAPSTILRREFAVKAKPPRKLNTRLTSPRKSNLTFTGRMLQSLKVQNLPEGIRIEPTGTRADGPATNAEITAFNAEKGRIYLQFSDREAIRLAEFIDDEISKQLARF